MTDYDTDPDAPPMEEVAEQLRHSGNGRRNIVSDADEVIGLTNNCVECHHHCRDGEITIQLKPQACWRMGDGEEEWMMSDDEMLEFSTYEI